MIDVEVSIAYSANDIHRRFRGFVERADLVQEGWLWTVLHPFRLKKFNEDENEKVAAFQLRTELKAFMERYARKQKAAALGYDIDDEYRYSRAQVEALLPAVFNGEVEQPVTASEAGGHAKQDPAEGGNYLAMYLDVSRALDRADLDSEDQYALVMRYGYGMSEQAIADDLEVTQQAVSSRLRRSLRRVVAELGGDTPRDCPFDCECHEGKLRLRPGIHSEVSGANQLAS